MQANTVMLLIYFLYIGLLRCFESLINPIVLYLSPTSMRGFMPLVRGALISVMHTSVVY